MQNAVRSFIKFTIKCSIESADESHADNAVNLAEGFLGGIGDVAPEIKNAVGIVAFGLTEHIFNVDALAGNNGGKLCQYIGNILVQYASPKFLG